MSGRIASVYRAQGARGVWFGALAWAGVYRRLELVELDLCRPPSPAPAAPTLDFGFLDHDELAAFARLSGSAGREVARARLERGDRCYVALEAGEIVSARWIASTRAWIAYLDRSIDLAPDVFYVYDAFTRAERRGEGVSAAASTRLARTLAAGGGRRLLAAVLRENRAGTRAYEKGGYQRVGRIGYLKLGPWRRDVIRTVEPIVALAAD